MNVCDHAKRCKLDCDDKRPHRCLPICPSPHKAHEFAGITIPKDRAFCTSNYFKFGHLWMVKHVPVGQNG